jgi:hypothetical protein
MMFLVDQEGVRGSQLFDPGLDAEQWWCNFVSGIMMPKFLPAVNWAARLLSRG